MFMKRVKNPRNMLMKAEVALGVFALDPVFVSVWMSNFRMKRGMKRGRQAGRDKERERGEGNSTMFYRIQK